MLTRGIEVDRLLSTALVLVSDLAAPAEVELTLISQWDLALSRASEVKWIVNVSYIVEAHLYDILTFLRQSLRGHPHRGSGGRDRFAVQGPARLPLPPEETRGRYCRASRYDLP